MWNEEFQLPNGSYSASDNQSYFEYILKKHRKTDNPSIKIYVNKIENGITSKTKTRYYLKLLTPETIKLLGSTKNKIINNVKMCLIQKLIVLVVVVLVHCNTANNNYQQNLRVLYTFVPNNSFGKLLDISLKFFIFENL